MTGYRFQVLNQSRQGLCGVLQVETVERFGVVASLRWSYHGAGAPNGLTGAGQASPSGSMLVLRRESGEEWARLLHCTTHEMRRGLSYTIQSAQGQDVATLVERTPAAVPMAA